MWTGTRGRPGAGRRPQDNPVTSLPTASVLAARSQPYVFLGAAETGKATHAEAQS